MRRGSRNEAFEMAIGAALEHAINIITELHEEIEQWRENLEDNDMTHLDKYDEVEQCASDLELAGEAAESLLYEHAFVLSLCKDEIVEFTQDTRRSATSRAARFANAEAAFTAVQERLDSIGDQFDDAVSQAEDCQFDADFPRAFS